MSFTAADVKTLREMTSVGMMDCKKALTECDGDMDKAVEYLREKEMCIRDSHAARAVGVGVGVGDGAGHTLLHHPLGALGQGVVHHPAAAVAHRQLHRPLAGHLRPEIDGRRVAGEVNEHHLVVGRLHMQPVEQMVHRFAAGLYGAGFLPADVYKRQTFDGTDVTEIFAQCPDDGGLGLAVANRLKKAAGFHLIDADRPLMVGLTGGTGAGKTSALAALEDLGGTVLDCDAVYHQMLRTRCV